MTAPACNGPVLPAFDELTAEELAQVTSKPLCCLSCGQELELRCPEGHVHQAKRRLLRGDGQPFAREGCGPRGPLRARTYKPKVCAWGTTFAPTGPRDTRCPRCKGSA